MPDSNASIQELPDGVKWDALRGAKRAVLVYLNKRKGYEALRSPSIVYFRKNMFLGTFFNFSGLKLKITAYDE